MTASPIRVAVFGAGYWGTKLCREYAAIGSLTGDLSLEYVVDSNASALDSIRKELGDGERNYCTDYRAALRSKDVDAVHIALPSTLHYVSARDALEADKHVLLEKPMALSSREAFKLASLAEERGLVLQVGHIFRFNSALRMVRAMIRGGRIGKVFYARLEWTVDHIPTGERDIIFDLAPHPIDVLNYLLDDWPSTVDAVGESYLREREGQEEIAFVNLEFPDSIVANVYLSWIQHGGKDRIIRIVGRDGTLLCDAIKQTIVFFNKEGSSKIPASLYPSVGSLNHASPGLQVWGNGEVPNNTIRDMQLQFLDTIRGRGPQVNSATIGARNVEVLEAITRSMRAKHSAKIQLQYPSIRSLAEILH